MFTAVKPSMIVCNQITVYPKDYKDDLIKNGLSTRDLGIDSFSVVFVLSSLLFLNKHLYSP